MNIKNFSERLLGGIIVSMVTFLMFLISMFWWSNIDMKIFIFISISLGFAFIIFGGSKEKLMKWLKEIINDIAGFG